MDSIIKPQPRRFNAPNEAMIQQRLIKSLEKQGCYVIKLMKTNKNGIPDLMVLKKGEKPYFIEVKAPNGTVKPMQVFRARELRRLGFQTKYVIDWIKNMPIEKHFTEEEEDAFLKHVFGDESI